MPLWRYVAFSGTDRLEVVPIAADTAARAIELARRAVEGSKLHGRALRCEILTPLPCATRGCRGHAATSDAGRYLCTSCSYWFAPTLW